MNSTAESVQNRCSDCGALSGHHPLCKLAPVEFKAAECERYYRAWLDNDKAFRSILARCKKDIAFWQGKHAMLRHENNRLRNKIHAKDR